MTLNLSLVPNLDIALNDGEHRIILITDQIASPADFVLHRVLSQCLKGSTSKGHIAVVSLERELAQWRGITARNNIQLDKHLANGNLTYIDGLSISSSSPGSSREFDAGEGYRFAPSAFQSKDEKTSLKGLYAVLEQTLQSKQTQPHILILDAPCILEFIGIPPVEITRFIRAVAGLYRSNTLSSLILVRDHITSPSVATSTPFDTAVVRLLVSLAHAHVEIRSLKTGRSGAVSGEICLHPGIGDLIKGQGGRAAAVQYKLTDSNAIFFQRGMSKGVL